MVVESDGASSIVLADHDGRASIKVAGGDDAVLGQNQNRARTFDLTIHVLYALHKIVFPCNHQGHKFGGIGGIRAEFGKLLVAVQALLLQLFDVVDFSHRRDGEPTKVGVHHDRLRIRIADNPDTGIPNEFTYFIIELGPEIGVLNIMNRTAE